MANAYDRQRFHHPRGRYHNWRLRRLLNKALSTVSPGSVVLDIPCGTGRIDNWLLNASLRVIAADISKAIVEFRVERRVKTAKRAFISWLTRRRAQKKMTVFEIADELSRCGLLADRYYFVSRWFSGSVLVTARRQDSGVVIVGKSFEPETVQARP